VCFYLAKHIYDILKKQNISLVLELDELISEEEGIKQFACYRCIFRSNWTVIPDQTGQIGAKQQIGFLTQGIINRKQIRFRLSH